MAVGCGPKSNIEVDKPKSTKLWIHHKQENCECYISKSIPEKDSWLCKQVQVKSNLLMYASMQNAQIMLVREDVASM